MKKQPNEKNEKKKNHLTTPPRDITTREIKKTDREAPPPPPPPRRRRDQKVLTSEQRSRLRKLASKFSDIQRQLEEIEKKDARQVAPGPSQRKEQFTEAKDKSEITPQEIQKLLRSELNEFFRILPRRQLKYGAQPCSRSVPRII